MERQGAGLGQGQRPEVVDRGGPRTRVSSRIAPRWASSAGMDAVEDRLDVALDDGERRPQLVGDVGEEAPALGLVRLEPGGHRVEAAGQLRDRAGTRAAALDARRVVAGLDPRGLLDEGVEDRTGPRMRAGAEEPGEDRDAATSDRRDPDERAGGPGAARMSPTNRDAERQEAEDAERRTASPNRQPKPRHGRGARGGHGSSAGHHRGGCRRAPRGTPATAAAAPPVVLDLAGDSHIRRRRPALRHGPELPARGRDGDPPGGGARPRPGPGRRRRLRRSRRSVGRRHARSSARRYPTP